MLPSSAFRSLPVCLSLDWLTLAGLHRVSTITVELRLLRRLRPPFHALAVSRPISGQGGVGVPQFQSMVW
jgi:hypothetical protein